VALLRDLKPFRVRVYDPAVKADPAWHPRLTQHSTALEACEGSDAVCLMTPWPEFASLPPDAVAKRMAGKLAIDPYRLLDGTHAATSGLDHITLGK
jgi:UDPglucose 6-dehydrogenase